MKSRDYICFNGEILTVSELHLSIENRSFRYGDGVFETIRCFGNQPMFFDLHYNRLFRALAILEINIKSIPSREVLLKRIESLINKNKIFISSRVRLTLFRNDGGLYTPQSNDCNYLIEVSPLNDNKYILNDKGLVAVVYNGMKKSPGIISPFKTANSLLFVLAGLYKKRMGVSEVFILNADNQIIEALASNLFWFKGDYLLTPSVSSGCVDGVMRRVIIELANKKGIRVMEVPGVSIDEIMDADELFITNAIQGVNWIVGIDNKRFYSSKTINIHRELNCYIYN
ncbi:MAG: aminotransferase class IV [Marinilabiliaceae bacterium]|nr:aminotransferase class IV [Marinilabiliaceae bacterium]